MERFCRAGYFATPDKFALRSQHYELTVHSAHNLVQNMGNMAIFKPPELYKKLAEVKFFFI